VLQYKENVFHRVSHSCEFIRSEVIYLSDGTVLYIYLIQYLITQFVGYHDKKMKFSVATTPEHFLWQRHLQLTYLCVFTCNMFIPDDNTMLD